MSENTPEAINVKVSLPVTVDPSPYIEALRDAGLDAERGPVRLQESADGSNAQFVILGISLSHEMANTIINGAVAGAAGALVTAFISSASGLTKKLISGVRMLHTRIPRLSVSFSISVGAEHIYYNLPRSDGDAALEAMLLDVPKALPEARQYRHRFWINGQWMPGLEPYHAYISRHAPRDIVIPRDALPRSVLDVVPIELQVRACLTAPDLFVDVRSVRPEYAESIVTALRSRLTEGRVGLDDAREYIHVEFRTSGDGPSDGA